MNAAQWLVRALEAEGVDKDGKSVELKLDPVTGLIVKSEVK